MKSIAICGVEVREWDVIRLTGECCSWASGPHRLENVLGTVATVDLLDEPAIKVWPHEDMGDGKLWFRVGDIERLEMLVSGADMRGEV